MLSRLITTLFIITILAFSAIAPGTASAAVTAGMTDGAKLSMLSLFAGHNIKVALYTAASASFTQASTVYSATGEQTATSSGYASGGYNYSANTCTASLTGSTPKTAQLTCPAASWTQSGSNPITADTAVLYDATDGNKILGIYSFTSATASGGGTFTLTLPANTLYLGP